MHEKPCPKCGHCPTCGRSNATPYGAAPWTWPWSPYPHRYPYATWTVGDTTPGTNYWGVSSNLWRTWYA